jgi:hypothetical protein
MSGGHFEYNQYRINDIKCEIDRLISQNKKEDEFGYSYNFSKKTLDEFKKAIKVLEKASVYTQRIDWLVSSDDCEDTFHERLKEDLDEIT